MNISIMLSSHLLAVALADVLVRQYPEFRVEVAGDEQYRPYCPDFVVTDCHALRQGVINQDQAAKVIVLDYGLGEEEMTSLLLAYKIDGVIDIRSDLEQFVKAVKAISTGQVWLDNRKVKALIHNADSVRAAGIESSLSKKEREIVVLIARGLMNKEIALQMCISEQTVKTHISRIFRKMNVTRRSQLVPFALKLMVPGGAP